MIMHETLDDTIDRMIIHETPDDTLDLELEAVAIFLTVTL